MAAEFKIEWVEVSRGLARSSSGAQPRSGPAYTNDTSYTMTGLTACLTQYSVTVSAVNAFRNILGTQATLTFTTENLGKICLYMPSNKRKFY